ncbi:hypothetical protein [Desulfovibrio ferrophilus]|uniref:Arginine dihydrolase ArgZ/ArgE-like C-terminal second subdomain domain-containing protein n=1 Tax=Desulfovibrio ferrophilus TaxID=241368 RepID=A0A2Z6AXS3_9BACT|nr:hypothetical protein [Desulfovibrio ferrophilus]BBD08062.1 uncharacterized protein DFE_1336 [Desulfovibrio ferrophilus]
MAFTLPTYVEPDFNRPDLKDAPLALFKPVELPGVAPEGYHATAIFPEYYHLRPGVWKLPRLSRMDCVVVLQENDHLEIKEFRNLAKGDLVACGRREDGEDGIYVHTEPFGGTASEKEKFAFRTRMSRETSFSIDYDELYDLLEHEREHGFICWVLGPAVVFDRDSREAMAKLVKDGYVHGLLAGNALATHDLEGAFYTTALGQEIYTKRSASLGHYHHLDALNRIRALGSMKQAVQSGQVKDGVMKAIIEQNIPYVLAGSIRDDGPMPEVIPSAYDAQDAMRGVVKQATTVIAMATQLHSIAVGNMTPSYTTMKDDSVRPVFFYSVDMSEFVVNKLANRGSLSARSILTNVQDFVVTTARGLDSRRNC